MVPPILTEPFIPTADRSGARLPGPDPAGIAVSEALETLIRDEIRRDGFLPFARFMELALYAPGMGYYCAGARKFGAAGDFVTAPELSPLFGRTLARPLAGLLEAGCDTIVELGAGSGKLAHDALGELERLDRMPRSYCILERSADLRERQQITLACHGSRVQWLDDLPQELIGIVLANEVFDALPVEWVDRRGRAWYRRGVGIDPTSDKLCWADRLAEGEVRAHASALAVPEDYTTEIHLAARGLVRSIADCLRRGVLLVLDYGFPAREYYHPDRNQGTLMCHYRQRVHADPLVLIGLQDITAHVDFSALAEAALEGGLELRGYTSQARFLIDCGILDLLAELDPANVARYAPACAAVQKLLSPSEMGELFKAIAFGRGIAAPLIGFRSGDRRMTL